MALTAVPNWQRDIPYDMMFCLAIEQAYWIKKVLGAGGGVSSKVAIA